MFVRKSPFARFRIYIIVFSLVFDYWDKQRFYSRNFGKIYYLFIFM